MAEINRHSISKYHTIKNGHLTIRLVETLESAVNQTAHDIMFLTLNFPDQEICALTITCYQHLSLS